MDEERSLWPLWLEVPSPSSSLAHQNRYVKPHDRLNMADHQLPEAICIRLVQGIFGGAVGVVSGASYVQQCRLTYSSADLSETLQTTRTLPVPTLSSASHGVSVVSLVQ